MYEIFSFASWRYPRLEPRSLHAFDAQREHTSNASSWILICLVSWSLQLRVRVGIVPKMSTSWIPVFNFTPLIPGGRIPSSRIVTYLVSWSLYWWSLRWMTLTFRVELLSNSQYYCRDWALNLVHLWWPWRHSYLTSLKSSTHQCLETSSWNVDTWSLPLGRS